MRHQPCIIFFDEVDTFTRDAADVGNNMQDMRNLLQTLWSNLANQRMKVLVIGTTNHPDQIARACLRRMELRFYIKLPSKAMRVQLIDLALREYTHQIKSEQVEELASLCEGLSGSDIKQAVSRAGVKGQTIMMQSTHFVDVRVNQDLPGEVC